MIEIIIVADLVSLNNLSSAGLEKASLLAVRACINGEKLSGVGVDELPRLRAEFDRPPRAVFAQPQRLYVRGHPETGAAADLLVGQVDIA